MMVRSDNKLTLYVAQILRVMLNQCLLTSHDITVGSAVTRQRTSRWRLGKFVRRYVNDECRYCRVEAK